MTSPDQLLPPGFRFHPTDEELIVHYLKNRAASVPCPASIIAEVDVYKFDPWDLPARATFGEKEWYFFTPRDRKYPNGVRPNRAAGSGYWKATGTDKPIVTVRSGKSEGIGVKKALVFYRGKPPKGRKTNWIMHEYRLADTANANANIHLRYSPPLKQKETSMRLDDWVLCRIYEKNNHHAGPSTVDDQIDMDPSLVTSFPELGGMQNRLQLHNELLAETDYATLSRLLHENTPGLPGQEQLVQQFNLGQTLNHHLFHGGNFSDVLAFGGVVQLDDPLPLMGGGGLKRLRMMEGLSEEDERCFDAKNLAGATGFLSPIDEPQQPCAMNQSYLLNSHYSFQ